MAMSSGALRRHLPRLRPWALFLVLIVVFGCRDAAPAAEDARLREFLDRIDHPRGNAFLLTDEEKRTGRRLSAYQYDRRAELRDRWYAWAPYLHKPFMDGLNEADRTRHQAAQKARDCRTIARLQRTGFLGLYPFLVPAFERADVAESFTEVILKHYAHPYVRCRNLRRLERAQAAMQREDRTRPPGALDLEPAVRRFFGKPLDARSVRYRGVTVTWRKAEHERCEALLSLARQAFFDDYVPALRDLARFIDDPVILVLPARLEFYLYRRAPVLGVATPTQVWRQYEVEKMVFSSRHELASAARSGDPMAAEIFILWSCPDPTFEKRK